MSALLEVERVSKAFSGIPVLKEVSLSLGAGHVLGIVGENGAGKSTLMNVLGLMKGIRKAIEKDRFAEFKDEFLRKYAL